MKKQSKFIISLVVALTSSILFLSGSASADDGRGGVLDYNGAPTEWTETEADTPTGATYRLFDVWGGFWADAEKDPDPGDNLLCWAATASNMMEWTGWGFVEGMEHDNTDTFFQYFRNHVTDGGHFVDAAVDWWFDGTLRDEGANAATEDVDHTGFWSGYTASTYLFDSWVKADVLSNIRTQLMGGKPVGLSIYSDGGGAHAVTCWGFNYDTSGTYTPADTEYYLGVWLSDSDSHKNQWNPPDMLRYYAVQWDSGDGRWEMPNYGGGWYIWGVTSLEIFPGATRPTAVSGGVYTGDEGSPVMFDAGASTGGTLEYRWDFDDDGVWDTGWISTDTVEETWDDDYATGNVYLEVFNERLRDMDITTVTINNVAPSITATGSVIDENGAATVSGTIDDPGVLDTFTVEIDWGEGSPVTYSYPAGSTTYSETHQYLDDDPTSTLSDDYMVSVTVTDKDGGSDTTTTTVTVNNVAPTVNAAGSVINENGTATVSGTINDPGTLDTFTVEINWGEGTPDTYSYPAGTTTYSESHQYLDDNPTGTASDEYIVSVTVTDDDGGTGIAAVAVTVNNLDPAVTGLSMDQPNEQFILPSVHELTFTGVFTDIGTEDTHTAAWNWGDGSPVEPDVVDETAGSGTVAAVHTYSTPGDYTVELTITDDDTGVGTMTFAVHVVDVDEALWITNDYIQNADDSYFDGKADKRKAALDAIFNSLNDMWVLGDYNGMIQDLRNNIREKADGTVDGKANNDWILDPVVQAEVCHKIDDITAYLETLL